MLFKILQKLSEKKVYYCFQSRTDGSYNLAVKDSTGRSHNFTSTDLTVIENELNMMWGRLLMAVPAPAGFPVPK